MRTRIRIGAQASDGSDDQMFKYRMILFVIMMSFDDDKMFHLVMTLIVRLRRSKRRRTSE